MTETVLLESRDIVRRGRDDVVLLDHISVRISAEERWAIVGPTGSGKTVLMRALSMLDPIDSGQILWRGAAVRDAEIPIFRRQVIYLQQKPALVEGDVEQNLQLPFQFQGNHNEKYNRDRVVDLLTDLQLDASFLQKSTADLSGGEAQITAILRALQLQPNIVLLDEPTAALDARSTKLVEQLVTNWFSATETERALVWVTHDSAQCDRVADKRLTLQSGSVATIGH